MNKIISDLLEQLEYLPGVGPKSAQRIAYYLLNTSKGRVKNITSAIDLAKQMVRFCNKCGNYATQDLCDICSSSARDSNVICVLEQPKDIFAMENSRKYNGIYMVLGGQINPIDNIGPEDLRIAALLERVSSENFKEVIIATNLNLEGEVTANFITKRIREINAGLRVSRLASGLPAGSDIEFADEVTLGRALEYRTPIAS